MENIQKLLDEAFPFAEKLLRENGEFYPLAYAIKNDDLIVPVATFYGEDFPNSSELLEKLKEAFVAKKNDYKALVILYDVRVVNPETDLKTDAIAVLAEEKNENISFTFFYPYSINQNSIEYSEPWKTLKENEVFNL